MSSIRVTSPLLIDNAPEAMRHNSTGRLLNHNNDVDKVQHEFTALQSEAFQDQLRAFKIAKEAIKLFKEVKPRTRQATLDHLFEIVIFCLLHPADQLQIPFKGNSNYRTHVKALEVLESLGLLEIFQGMGRSRANGGSIPLCVQATQDLLNLI